LILVVGFTYFYTDIIFGQQNVAETLRRQGGVIEGLREGRPTKEYLQKVMRRITFVGAIYLGLIAVLAWIVSLLLQPFGIDINPGQDSTFIVGSVGLIIVVGVVLDTMKQLEAQLTMRHYERFIGR
jgi:preprotein translocase subunit SecY